MFTFRESTAAATARNRLIVDGDIPAACGRRSASLMPWKSTCW